MALPALLLTLFICPLKLPCITHKLEIKRDIVPSITRIVMQQINLSLFSNSSTDSLYLSIFCGSKMVALHLNHQHWMVADETHL